MIRLHVPRPPSESNGQVPPRWQRLREFFDVLLAPLVDAVPGGLFMVEAGSPDGQKWTRLDGLAVPLQAAEPGLEAARAVSILCGTTAGMLDPGPEAQRTAGVYYAVASFSGLARNDFSTTARSAIVLDIDAKSVGGEAGVVAAASRVPRPTAVVRSGGGVHLVYVLREALVFDREDESKLLDTVRNYLSVALGLERAASSDEMWVPSHLFRCPATYWLKREPPKFVTIEDLEPSRRFNMSDFEDFRSAEKHRIEKLSFELHSRLLGRSTGAGQEFKIAPPDGVRSLTLPARVSREIVTLLNTGLSTKYARRDGSLDRSRAVFAACLSLLNAGLSDEEVATAISWSGLRDAVEERGDDGGRWLAHQIKTARDYKDREVAGGRR